MAKKFSIIFIAALTIFSLGLRAYRLNQPPRYYFDEVYHAITAKAYADNNRDAYDPFAQAPKEGTAYDWLHPPLAKLIQAASIKILGDQPLGWRVPSLIFGTAIIPLTFALAFLLFGPSVAIFSSTAVAFENMTFVMSRITMNDVFITAFSLSAFIFAALYTRSPHLHPVRSEGSRFFSLRLQNESTRYLFLTAFFLGLAITSKWTGFYTVAAIFGFILLNDLKNKRLNFKILVLIIVPILMYIGSYGQFWIQGHTISDFVNLHKQIWWYQNRHDLEHSYGTTPLYCIPHGLKSEKTWCPWVLDTRGVYFSYEQYGQRAGYIYALGNPLIFWFGVIAVSYVLGKFLEEKKKVYGLILIGYFIFWVPWIFTPRLLFLYHYLPAIPFLSIALGISLATIYKTKFRILSLILLLVFVATFFYFYPISSGLPIDPSAIDKYMWLGTWR